MNAKRVFSIFLCAIVSLALLTSCSNSRPKSSNDFIKNYNNEIKTIAKKRNLDYKPLLITNVDKQMGIHSAMFAMGGASYTGVENNSDTVVAFNIDTSNVTSNVVFAIIESAILASGGDVEKVMTGLGVQNGNQYNIPGNYFQEYNYKKELSYDIGNDGELGIISFEAQMSK